MPIGFRVFEEISRPDRANVEAISSHFSADIADAMQKAGWMSRAIRPVYEPMPKFFGPAVTASLPTASFSMAKLAMLKCQPGDVLVINAYEDVTHALLGGHIANALVARGLAGVIIDGAARDSSELKEAGLPVCARGTAVVVGGHDGPGEINVPIACGGTVVNPGDVIVSDSDGIVVVPRDYAQEVIAATDALVAKLDGNGPAYSRGEIPGMDEVESRIRASGCEFSDRR